MRKSTTARRGRAAVILFFIMVALPLVWIAGALSVDYARVRMTRSEAQQIANSAANAAAPIAAGNQAINNEVILGGDTIRVEEAAQEAARDLILEACDSGANIRSARFESCSQVADAATVELLGDGAVSVSFEYRIDGLIFLHILDAALELSNDTRNYSASVSATSSACSIETQTAQESCFRPAR